jgi:hypothetical protein
VLGKVSDAERDFRTAVSARGRKWVQGRSHLELGKLFANRGDHGQAQQEFKTAIALCSSDNDPVGARQARRLLE